MTLLDIGTWNIAELALDPGLHAAITAVFTVAGGPQVLALQGLRGRIALPDGVAGYQPEGTDGEPDNAVLWAASRFERIDAYAVRLSERGWRSPDGSHEPRRVTPCVLLRDLVDGTTHAFGSVRMPAGLDQPSERDPDEARRSVAAEALHGIGNHADRLRRSGVVVHVAGDWGVDVLADDGRHDAWPEAAVGDVLTSARRRYDVPMPGAPAVDWRTSASVLSATVAADRPALLVARVVTDR